MQIPLHVALEHKWRSYSGVFFMVPTIVGTFSCSVLIRYDPGHTATPLDAQAPEARGQIQGNNRQTLPCNRFPLLHHSRGLFESGMNIYSVERTASFARIRFQHPEAIHIAGTIRGPFCRYARTLPTNHAISDGEAVVVDPCYWSTELPFRYEIKLELQTASGVEQLDFRWGIRGLVPHKKDLRREGKRYVVRAISPKMVDFELADLREMSATLRVQHSSEMSELYEEASEAGVMLTVVADEAGPELSQLLNGFPAVSFLETDHSSASVQHTDLLSVGPSQSSSNIVSVDEAGADLGAVQKPVFASRAVDASSLQEMRNECDALQRDVAKYGQFSGYVITSK